MTAGQQLRDSADSALDSAGETAPTEVDTPQSWRARSRPPAPAWTTTELAIALGIMAATQAGYLPFSATPWLLLVAATFLWWRGPGWRGVGLARPANPRRVLAIGIATGVGYQVVGLYLVEPLIASMTTGKLPDVSAFRPLVGDEVRLAFWLAMSWTFAAFLEEMVYRGWLMSRLAEAGHFSAAAWVVAAIASSALFGIAHLYQGISGVVATGLTGLVFAGAYLASGRSLWAAILAHGILDTTGFVMIYLGVYPGL
ncbi:MAG: CPBP family intramembrane metalloprotease [Acidobacteria bacterium]|nr:MAG: CPBP family intramembrane metalloprotease [Acidobacteriota bacterium]